MSVDIWLDAARQGHIGYLRSHLEYLGTRDTNGCTAYLIASKNGHLPILQLLADEASSTDTQGCTGLMHAAANGHAACVKYLLGRADSTNDRDFEGKTPLMHAAMFGRSDAVASLLTETCMVDTEGRTALIYATGYLEPVHKERLSREEMPVTPPGSKMDYAKCVMLLQKELHMADDHSRLAIHYALYFACTEIMETMLMSYLLCGKYIHKIFNAEFMEELKNQHLSLYIRYADDFTMGRYRESYHKSNGHGTELLTLMNSSLVTLPAPASTQLASQGHDIAGVICSRSESDITFTDRAPDERRKLLKSYEIVERIKDDCKCGICCDILWDPLMLDCTHVFCTCCLESLLRTQNFACPICKKTTRGYKTAPFALKSIVDLLRSQENRDYNPSSSR